MVYDAVIVGGGLAGLSCAVALAENGVKPLVLERASRLGGRAHSVTDASTGDVIDIGPHLVHSEYRTFPAFLDRRTKLREASTVQQHDKQVPRHDNTLGLCTCPAADALSLSFADRWLPTRASCAAVGMCTVRTTSPPGACTM